MTGHYRFQHLEQAKNYKKYSSFELVLSGMVNSTQEEDVTVFLKFYFTNILVFNNIQKRKIKDS